jgi:hypothetical protein
MGGLSFWPACEIPRLFPLNFVALRAQLLRNVGAFGDQLQAGIQEQGLGQGLALGPTVRGLSDQQLHHSEG